MQRLLPVVHTARLLLIAVLAAVFGRIALAGQVDPYLEQKLQSVSPMEKVRIMLYLTAQVDLQQMEIALQASVPPGKRLAPETRYRTVLSALQRVAESSQPAVIQRIAPYEADGQLSLHYRFWIRNMVVVSATPQVVRMLAALPDVETAYLDGLLVRDIPVAVHDGSANPEASEPGLRAINAHKLWALGYNGAGRIVMNIDTGVEGNNQSFNARWRGNLPGVPASAAWFDPETSTTFPTDGDGSTQHGTHTMGIMCGLYTATNDTLGVAPGANWIAAKTLNTSPHTSNSIAAFQWAADPDGNPGTIDDVPDAISCSWYDPDVASTECTGASGYYAVIDAVEALGTGVVFSAGNNGPTPSSITPPKNRNTTAVNIFAVGAVDGNTPAFPIADFSSRGPGICPGPDSLRYKPDVSAPGVDVRSAHGTSGFEVLSGTSMASPHVAGSIALLRQVAPFLTGTQIKYILLNTAHDLGTVGDDNDYGHGIIDLWAAYLALPLNMGYVKGHVTSGGNPLSGVTVDFVDNVLQLPGTSDGSGDYKASAQIDTPFTSAQYTLRAQKFGYLTHTDTITLALSDTVTRNIALTPAPGGTLQVHAFTNDSSAVRANVKVVFAGLTVINDYTDSTTGFFSAPLPVGSYTVSVDPPSPYGTQVFTPVDIQDSQTTAVDAHLRFVVEPSPQAIRDTLVVGQISSKTLTLTNTTAGPLNFRLTDDNAILKPARPRGKPVKTYPGYELAKDVKDPHAGIGGTEGRGGPDAFGYQWVDSDEPDGPVFNWVDISSTGTPITTWTGSGDDGYAIVPLGFSFPFYGVTYNQIKVVTNGWISFDVASTSNAYSNTAIPSTPEPNTSVYMWWDDLDVRTSGTIHYYDDVANSRFIVQYTNAPHFSGTPGVYTFQVILYPNGNMLYQYLDMQQTVNSATIGIENAAGDDGLQTVFNAAYVHNTLAIAFRLPDAPWVSENPATGTIPPGGSQPVTVAFDATGLTVGSLYNANIFIDSDNPDQTAPIPVPVSLNVELADSAVLILSSASMTFPAQQINTTVRDTLTVRNGGLQTLNISSIASNNGVFVVSPSSATLTPNDSVWVVVAYTPTTVGTDTGRITFLSNSQGSPEIHAILTGTAIGAPAISLNPTSLADTLQVGDNSTLTFTITNTTPLPTTPLYVTLSDSAAWLSIAPAADTLAGGASGTFTVSLNATGLPLGSISANITIASNDPAAPSTTLTCTLLVTGGPVIVVRPDSLARSLNAGTILTDTLVVKNTGLSTLNWTLTETPSAPPQHSAGPAPAAIELPKDAKDPGTGGPVTEGQGGPDGYGYRWIDSDEPGGPTFTWVDISSVGTPITTWDGSPDDGHAIVPLPFSFPFYGTGYNQLKVVTNGWVSLDVISTDHSYSNTAIPATAEPNLSVYPWWDDLDLSSSGTVHYYDDAANNRFIVQWTNVPHYGTSTPGLYTFQVILNASGSVQCQYLDMQQTLNSATLGIENADGTDGLQVVYNAAYMHNNLAILYSRGISWLTEDPTTGSVTPGDSTKVAVTFNSTGLSGGIYRGNLQFASNDLGHNPRNVPVTLHVAGVPGISVPASIPFGVVFLGDTARINLVVKNIGSDILNISAFSIVGGSGAFTMNLSPASIGIGDSLVRSCSFIPQTATPYSANCMIYSNDPDDDTVAVALSGSGSQAPAGSVWPTSITRVLQSGLVDSSSFFAIRNAGGSPLTWQIAEIPGAEATARMFQGTEQPNADDPRSDVAPFSLRFDENLLALGDTLFSFDVQNPATPPANVQLGVEFALNHYWVTGRSLTDNVKNLYKFDRNGNLVATYPQGTTSVFGWRDLAFDGTYLYTSDENEFAKIDPATGAKVGTLPKPAGQTVLRGLAFDPVTRTFWTKNFGGALVHFDSTGITLGTFTNALAAYGLAWDRWSPGGPFLWMWSQNGPVGMQKVTATQINPANGQPTGVTFLGHNYSALPDTDLAGGATISNEIDPTRLVFLALHQSVVDRVVGYDLNVTLGLPWVDASIVSGTTASHDSTRVKAIFRTQGIPGGVYTGRFRITTNDPAAPVLYVDLSLDVLVGVNEDRTGTPLAFELDQNYPNPFNPSTRVEYGLPEGSTVTLRIYDILGREVRVLVDGHQDAGYYRVEWDGRSLSGGQVASGMYFYRLEATSVTGRTYTSMKKMLLMK